MIRRALAATWLLAFASLGSCLPAGQAPTPQPTTSAAMRNYALEVEELLYSLEDARAELSRLTADPRPADPNWPAAVAQQIATILYVQRYAQARRAPEEMRPIQAALVAAAGELSTSVDLLAAGKQQEAEAVFAGASGKLGAVEQQLHDFLGRRN